MKTGKFVFNNSTYLVILIDTGTWDFKILDGNLNEVTSFPIKSIELDSNGCYNTKEIEISKHHGLYLFSVKYSKMFSMPYYDECSCVLDSNGKIILPFDIEYCPKISINHAHIILLYNEDSEHHEYINIYGHDGRLLFPNRKYDMDYVLVTEPEHPIYVLRDKKGKYCILNEELHKSFITDEIDCTSKYSEFSILSPDIIHIKQIDYKYRYDSLLSRDGNMICTINGKLGVDPINNIIYGILEEVVPLRDCDGDLCDESIHEGDIELFSINGEYICSVPKSLYSPNIKASGVLDFYDCVSNTQELTIVYKRKTDNEGKNGLCYWGLMNKNFKLVFQPVFQELTYTHIEGIFICNCNGFYGLISKQGNFIVFPKHKVIYATNFDVFVAVDNCHREKKDSRTMICGGKRTIYNSNGDIIGENYDKVKAIEDIIIVNRENKWDVINYKGHKLNAKSLVCDKLYVPYNNISRYLKDGKYGYVDTKLNKLTDAIFECALDYDWLGSARVIINGERIKIDKFGNTIGTWQEDPSDIDDNYLGYTDEDYEQMYKDAFEGLDDAQWNID